MSEARKIGKREVDGLPAGGMIWDASVAGFGARRQRGPGVTYVLKYRTADGRQRWATIGRHGSPWTPETARQQAKVLLGELAQGRDPAAIKSVTVEPLTVRDLCTQYMDDAEAGRVLSKGKVPKRPNTLLWDHGRIDRHILPILGSMAAIAVTRQDVERLLFAIAEGKTACRVKTKARGLAVVTGGSGTANRVVGLLSGIFAYAVRQGIRPDNPAHGTTRFADKKRERRLADDEYARFAHALRLAEATDIWPPALGVAQFLLLTGWRRGEAIGLRWDELDLERRTAVLKQSKTGRSMRPLCSAACDLLRGMPRADDVLVFPASRGEGLMSGFPKYWARIMKHQDLPSDITPHVLRHSYASLAADLGFSEPTIAALIGHARHSVTSRYVHSADHVLLSAADTIASAISGKTGNSTRTFFRSI